MKAQHRKELQHNALADRLAKLVESAKHGPNRTVMIVGGFVVLALLLTIGWIYYSRSSASKSSERWLLVDEASSLKELEKIASEDTNSMQSRVARLQVARVQLREGIEKLYSLIERKQAREELENARRLFEQLAKESSDTPVMTQEALMGAGKASESLGEIDKALPYYEKLVKLYPNSVLGKEADDHLKNLQGGQGDSFYSKLNKMAEEKNFPGDPFPFKENPPEKPKSEGEDLLKDKGFGPFLDKEPPKDKAGETPKDKEDKKEKEAKPKKEKAKDDKLEKDSEPKKEKEKDLESKKEKGADTPKDK